MRPPPILPPVERRPKRRRRSFLLSFLGFSFASGVVLFLVGAAVGGYFLWQATSDLPSYDSARVHGFELSASEVSRVARMLEAMPMAARLKVPSLEPLRADVIVVGAALLEAIVERAGVPGVVVSDRGVRWGLAEASLTEPATVR